MSGRLPAGIERLEVAASVDELARVRAFVREVSARHGARPATITDLVQAIDECATNVMVHGYRGGEGWLRVEIERAGRDIVVRLFDRAPPFDPTQVPTPDVSRPLARPPTGGMGVLLARELTDEMTYRHTGVGNELTMVKRNIDSEEEGDAEHQR